MPYINLGKHSVSYLGAIQLVLKNISLEIVLIPLMYAGTRSVP
jgi:hypothetical protein